MLEREGHIGDFLADIVEPRKRAVKGWRPQIYTVKLRLGREWGDCTRRTIENGGSLTPEGRVRRVSQLL